MRTRSSSPSMDDYERRVRETPARPAPPPPPRPPVPVGRPNPPPPPPPQQQQSPATTTATPEEPQQQHDHPPLLPPLQFQLQNVVDNNNNNRTNEAWILNVRPPRSASFNSNSSSTVVRRIRVHPDMDVATLSACLQQALGVTTDVDRISGLFQESTELFLPLQHILTLDDSDDNPQRQLIYTLELPELPTPTRRKTAPWWEHAVVKYGFIPITAAWIVYWYSYRVHVHISHWIASTLHTAYHVTLELPLQETYRHGPWFLGAWEGESLPRICARITYHGDQAFWERNLTECQRIFDAKLEAWLRLTRPVVGLVVVMVLVWAFRLTILAAWRARAVAAQHVRPVDREILDFYRAFQVVTRQIQRVTMTTTHVPEPPPLPTPAGPRWRHRR